jgi:Flp pilus assembly protein TadG
MESIPKLNKVMVNQRGVTFVFITLAIVALLAFTALAVDIGHLFVVRNELKNAADAGALAGARVLYNNNGTAVNPGANQEAYDAATANKSEKLAVEVNLAADPPDIQRGHWRFATRTFTPDETTLEPPVLWNVSNAELDANLHFVNAVRVQTRREANPAASFFARLFGFENFILRAESVAYIGFAGTMWPEDVDQPIAICLQSISDPDGKYTCATGRMIDSGGGTTHNSGAWTNFSQPCETATPPSVRPLVCGGGNPKPITFGEGMGTIGGMTDNVYRDMRDCWLSAPLLKDWRGYPIERWGLTLPVIDCPGNNPGSCSEVIGTVTLNVIWIKQSGTDSGWTDIPLKVNGFEGTQNWECSIWRDAGRPENINSLDISQRQQCWREFANHFNLQTANGTSVGDLTPSQLQKTIFFLPSCEYHELKGTTGGRNFGVLARIPVLVK